MTGDLYAELGVARTATADEIKRAYRKLARELHPDRNPGNRAAEDRFKRVSYAHDVLANEKKRKIYDEFGAEGLREGFDPERARAAQAWGGKRGFGNDFNDVGESFFGGTIEELLRNAGAGGLGGTGRRVGRRKRPVDATLDVSLREALEGAERTLQVQSADGARRDVRVRIPAGAREGSRLRVAGAAGDGVDITITLHILEHPVFRLEGSDLHARVPVTIAEAWRGGPISVPTPSGEVTLKLPPGVSSGAKLRLRGKGAPRRGQSAGDLIVEVSVVLPAERPAALDDAIAALAAAYREDVRQDLRW